MKKTLAALGITAALIVGGATSASAHNTDWCGGNTGVFPTQIQFLRSYWSNGTYYKVYQHYHFTWTGLKKHHEINKCS